MNAASVSTRPATGRSATTGRPSPPATSTVGERLRENGCLFGLAGLASASVWSGFGSLSVPALVLAGVFLAILTGGSEWLAVRLRSHSWLLFLMMAWIWFYDASVISKNNVVALIHVLGLQLALMLYLCPRREEPRRAAFFVAWATLMGGSRHGMSHSQAIFLMGAFVLTPFILAKLYSGSLTPGMRPNIQLRNRLSAWAVVAALGLTGLFFVGAPREGLWRAFWGINDSSRWGEEEVEREDTKAEEIEKTEGGTYSGQAMIDGRNLSFSAVRSDLLDSSIAFDVYLERGTLNSLRPWVPPRRIRFKAATYDTYKNGQWHSNDTYLLQPLSSLGPISRNETVILQNIHLVTLETVAIIGISPTFIPKRAPYHSSSAGNLQFTRTLEPPSSYEVISYRQDQKLPPDALPGSPGSYPGIDYLQIPEELRSDIQYRSRLMVEGAHRPAEKAKRIRDFLLKNFDYSLSAKFFGDEDPVISFLKKKTPGYCVHFATATALLLRSVGIPSRIVMGYTSNEWRNDRLQVRHRNAHAWAEANFGKLGWVALDATPTMFLARSREEEKTDQDTSAGFSNWLSLYTGALQAQWLSRFGTWAAMNWFYLAVGLIGLGIILVSLRNRRDNGIRHYGRRRVRDLSFYHDLLRALDRRGFPRPLTMTPRQFAGNLAAQPFGEDLQAVTLAFESARYGGQPLPREQTERIRHALRRIDQTLRKRGPNGRTQE